MKGCRSGVSIIKDEVKSVRERQTRHKENNERIVGRKVGREGGREGVLNVEKDTL